MGSPQTTLLRDAVRNSVSPKVGQLTPLLEAALLTVLSVDVLVNFKRSQLYDLSSVVHRNLGYHSVHYT